MALGSSHTRLLPNRQSESHQWWPVCPTHSKNGTLLSSSRFAIGHVVTSFVHGRIPVAYSSASQVLQAHAVACAESTTSPSRIDEPSIHVVLRHPWPTWTKRYKIWYKLPGFLLRVVQTQTVAFVFISALSSNWPAPNLRSQNDTCRMLIYIYHALQVPVKSSYLSENIVFAYLNIKTSCFAQKHRVFSQSYVLRE